MDQLRKAWSWLQRHHFWVLTVAAVCVALGCWWRGANALWDEYQSNKSKIETEFSAANTVRSKPFHANAGIQEAQQQEITSQQQTVNDLWKQLYERQTAGVLKWPGNLSDDFRNYVTKLKFGENIPRNLRSHYNNYIRDHFPELPKIVGALEEPEGEGGGGYGGRGAGSFDVQSFIQNRRTSGLGGPGRDGTVVTEEPDFIVVWADQALVRGQLAPSTTPSAKRIWKTQEDLWVYEALLQIIAQTNAAAGADRFSNAAIRVIESLEVGKTAAQASRGKGRIEMLAPPAAEGELGVDGGYGERGMPMEGGATGMEGAYGRGEMGGEMYGGEMGGRMGVGMDAEASDAELFNNRYLDAAGAPIPATGEAGPEAFGKEFKRLPVRMQLWMDQRWLTQLIAECASAPLQVEIQEVRINPSENAGNMGGGSYSRGGGGYGMSGSPQGEEMTPEPEPNMKTVILQGTIYIFNPPTEEESAGQVAATQ